MSIGLNLQTIAGKGGITDEIRNIMQPYYQSYINAGGRALPQLESQYSRLLSDPGALLRQIGAGYQKSPGYQYNVDEATRAANQAAAAGGMLGSPAQREVLAKRIADIASQDYGDYMNRGLGLYGTGLQGLGNINQLGYGASTGLAEILGNARLTQYQADMYRQMMEDQDDDGFFDIVGKGLGLVGGAGSALGGLSGGITGWRNLFGSKRS